MPKWTDSQNNAINARGSNIIVSAAKQPYLFSA